MTAWFMYHRQAIAATLTQMLKTPVASLLTLFAIGITLSLPAGLYVALENLTRITGSLPAHVEITVFMQDSSSPNEIAKLQQQIAALPGISSSRFVAKKTALSALSLQMGVSALASELPENPLPDAWIITPASSDLTLIRQLVTQLQQLPAVASVQADQQWMQRLHALLALGRDMVVLLAIILAVALISISGNTIRLQILTRHAEIEVSRLIGATDSFIQRPFLYFGVIQGLMGAMIAWVIISLGIALLAPQVSLLANLYSNQFTLHGLDFNDTLILLSTASLLGWIGAYLAVGRTLAQIEKTP